MTPEQLLKLEPFSSNEWGHEDETNDISILSGLYYNFIPELNGIKLSETKFELITIEIIKNHLFDHRRYWRLAIVYFAHFPVMIIQNAGREGDDHAKRFLLDIEMYKKMLQYLIRFATFDEEIISLDENREDLDTFYGHKLLTDGNLKEI